jgi:surfactin synthase thioesterase subunit
MDRGNLLIMNSRWFIRPRPRQAPSLRLICFPYAGGNAGTYVPWAAHLPPGVELVAVQLPGRGTRLDELPFSDMEPLVHELLAVFPAVIDRPYVLFGHSLGSRVAFELALRCQRRGWPLPVCFIASGSRAAHLAEASAPLHDLPEAEFIDKLRELNGTPAEVLENLELIQLLTPLLRADFRIADLYRADGTPLDCPIAVLAGTEDEDVTPQLVEGWRDLTTAGCEIHWIPGGHFFIERNRAQVLGKINTILAQASEARWTPATARPEGSAAAAKLASQAIAAAEEQAMDLPPGTVLAQATPGKCWSKIRR